MLSGRSTSRNEENPERTAVWVLLFSESLWGTLEPVIGFSHMLVDVAGQVERRVDNGPSRQEMEIHQGEIVSRRNGRVKSNVG